MRLAISSPAPVSGRLCSISESITPKSGSQTKVNKLQTAISKSCQLFRLDVIEYLLIMPIRTSL